MELAKEFGLVKELELVKEYCKSFMGYNFLEEEYLLAGKIKKEVILVEKYRISQLPPVDIPPIHHDNENHKTVAAAVKSYCDEKGIDWTPEVTTKFGPDVIIGEVAIEVGSTPPERITSRLQEGWWDGLHTFRGYWDELWVFPYGGEYEKELSRYYYIFTRGKNWEKYEELELGWRRKGIEETGRLLDLLEEDK